MSVFETLSREHRVFGRLASRSVGRSLNRRLQASVRGLELDLRQREAAISECLERGIK